MSAPTPQVVAYFDLSATGGAFLTLDSTQDKGKLDNVAAILAGNISTDVTSLVNRVGISRGRPSQVFADIPAGIATVQFNNEDRAFDPTFEGLPLVDSDGNPLTDEDGETLYSLPPSDYMGNILPGKRFDIRAGGVTIYSGIVEDWNFDYEVSGRSVAFAELGDALAQLARAEFDAWTATAAQTAGPRITAALDRSEVNFTANRSIDTGVSTLQGDSVTWGSNVLNYLQLVTRSDLGYLYAARDNVVTFRDRHANLNATAAVTFSDDGTGVPFSAIEANYGAERLFNRVGIDREGGTLQTASDATAQTAYGPRSLTQSGLLLDSDTQSLAMANYLLGIYSQPELRVSSLSVGLAALTSAQQASVLALDITSLVSVTFTPNGLGAAVERTCIVEGISHDITPDSHFVTLHLGDADRRSVLQLDDTVFGRLDANVLAF